MLNLAKMCEAVGILILMLLSDAGRLNSNFKNILRIEPLNDRSSTTTQDMVRTIKLEVVRLWYIDLGT